MENSISKVGLVVSLTYFKTTRERAREVIGRRIHKQNELPGVFITSPVLFLDSVLILEAGIERSKGINWWTIKKHPNGDKL